MKINLLIVLLSLSLSAFAQDYPAAWFKEVPRSEASSWEILPQDAAPGEVILSKRTELGIFSNFGATPFTLDGKSFASIEGLWQSLKYPDPLNPDLRNELDEWPFTRAEVESMVGFEAKDAGTLASNIYKKNKLKNVSWNGHFFDYVDHKEGSAFHYILIKRALRAKLDQNPGLWSLLMRTGCLKLKPDHKMNESDPPAYHYYKIFMELRREKQFVPCEIEE